MFNSPITNPYGGPDKIVDKKIGDAYVNVKKVSEVLGELLQIAAYIENLVTVSDNLDIVAPVSAAIDDVSAVANNLNAINAILADIDYITQYLGSYDEVPTERPDGSSLLDGDFYFNGQGLTYYDSSTGSWLAVNPGDISSAANTVLTKYAELENDIAALSEQVDGYMDEASTVVESVQDALDTANTIKDQANALIGGSDIGDYTDTENPPTFENETDYVVFGRGTEDVSLWRVRPTVILPYTVDSAAYPHPSDDDGHLVAYSATADLYSYQEEYVLAAGQQVITTASELANFAVFIQNTAGDDVERLFADTHFTFDRFGYEINLKATYPTGSKVILIFNDVGQIDDSYIKKAEASSLYGDHTKQANRGAVNSHPATAIQTTGGASVETALAELENRANGVVYHGTDSTNGIQHVKNGDTVPAGSELLSVLVDGKVVDCVMYPVGAGQVNNLTASSATIGGELIKLIPKKDYLELRSVAIANNTSVDNVAFLYDGAVGAGEKYWRDIQNERNMMTVGEVPYGAISLGTYNNGILPFSVNGVTYHMLNAAKIGQSWITAEEIGLYSSDHSAATADSQNILNLWLPYIGIELKSGKTYSTTGTVYFPDNAGLRSSGKGRAIIQLAPTKSLLSVAETKDYATTEVRNLFIDNIQFNGTLQDFTVSEVNNDVTGSEGFGLLLSCGTSHVNVFTRYTAGVGIIFSNNGDSSRYVHGNELNIVASDSGQEGIILESGRDLRIKYIESQWSWNTRNDTSDYTQIKTSKYLASYTESTCAGTVFLSGSAEVENMHCHNNHFGYAWVTQGQSGSSYRLRIQKGIGESSAASFRIGVRDDVTAAHLLSHSPKGKDGEKFCYIPNIANCHIGMLDCRLSTESPQALPSCGIYADGDNVIIDKFKLYTFTGTQPDTNAVYIQGNNNDIKGHIYGVDGGVDLAYPTTGLKLDLEMVGCENGLLLHAPNNKVGDVNVNFKHVTTPLMGDSHRFISSQDVKKFKLWDQTNDLSLDLNPVLTTIDSSLCDGTDRTVSVSKLDGLFSYTSGNRYHLIKTRSITVAGMPTDLNTWIVGESSDAVVIGYNITSSSDVTVTTDFYYTGV